MQLDLKLHLHGILCYSYQWYPYRLLPPWSWVEAGDPLSPFLFLIVAKVLGIAFKNVVELGNVKGLQVSNGAPNLSHLHFVDDTHFIRGSYG